MSVVGTADGSSTRRRSAVGVALNSQLSPCEIPSTLRAYYSKYVRMLETCYCRSSAWSVTHTQTATTSSATTFKQLRNIHTSLLLHSCCRRCYVRYLCAYIPRGTAASLNCTSGCVIHVETIDRFEIHTSPLGSPPPR